MRRTGASDSRAFTDVVRAAVAEVLGVAADAVSPTAPLREAGVDSAGMVRLAAALSVPAWAVWQYPTVAALADHLAGAAEPAPAPAAAGAATTGVEPIAVVGLGCRLPGGIESPAALWDALLSEMDAVRPVPGDRWDVEEWYDEDVAAPGRTTVRRGGFLDDVAGFDAAFFRISPAEAERMDPQQRIALEVAWSALEDARIVPGALAGSRAGVFLGTMWQEYHLATGADPASVGPQSAVGWDTSIVPARIAYALGLQGPAVSVGSACSSSLNAVHLAAHSLRRGESDLALAGGVSLMLHPHTTVAMTKFGGLNPADQCRAFDADAAGYVRGEGCGVLVLRRLSDALRTGDRIYAVLRGSAVNNDGASNGLTAPNPRAQVDVLREAWREAGVAPAKVSYVEAHGTGTALGDVIEAGALGEVFAPGRTAPLLIGSAKTNFGHLEPAAGVLGVLKTVLALHHGELPASLHFDRPNPRIDFAGQRLEVVTGRRDWPQGRFAGVSGFGFGGTNVHLALERATPRPRRLVALAAPTESALRARVGTLLAEPAPAAGGSGHYRAFAAVDRLDELPAGLRVSLDGRARPPLAFCFSGHGGQWVGMGRDLLAEPAFRAALTEVDRALVPVVGWSVLDELVAPSPRLNRTDVVQPALFAIQVALARALAAWGVRPDVVFGQSVGEVAAAVVAGALTTADGALVIGRWSRLVADRAAGSGTVLVCELSAARARRVAGDRLDLAGELAPGQVCLSGGTEAVAEVERELTAAGVRTLRVAIDYPSHSRRLAPLASELAGLLDGVVPAETTIPFVSTVTGAVLPGAELDGAYWARNMCAPMLVAEAVRALPAGTRVVEVAPHPVLRPSLGRALAGGPDVLVTCRRDRPARWSLEDLLGRLWTDGVDVDWAALDGGTSAGPPVPWVLSARTPAGLRAQAAALRDHLTPEASPAEVGFSLATTRTAFEHRAVLLGEDRRALLEALAALADGVETPAVVVGSAGTVDPADPGPVLVFPGQGSQWVGMARELLDTAPVFAARFTQCADALAEFVDWSPVEALADEAALARVDVVQPLLWAVMVSLAELWRAHGVRPAAVVGHSQGEIAAACVAGGLSVRDAALVVALRSAAIARGLAGRGGMASVALPRERLARLVGSLRGRLSVAAANGPGSTVVSGDPETLEELLARCRADGVRAKQIPVDYASHSAQVDAVRAELLDRLAPIRPRSTDVTFLSTVTGEPVDTAELDAAYWYRNLREPVEFHAAVVALASAGHRYFVEASPHPVLTMGVQETGDLVAVGSLRRDDGDLRRFRASVAEAWTRGVPVDWSAAFPGARPVDLPTYRFQRQRYWLDGTRPRPASRPATGDTALWEAVDRGDSEAVLTELDLRPDGSLADLVPALRAWRRRGREEAAVRDWWYEDTWTAVPDPVPPADPGTWLALVPAAGDRVGEVLHGLAEAGLKLVTLDAVADPEELARRCAEAAGEHELAGVVSLLALGPAPRPLHART
ncbi:type I polyketide synthase, partial [Actinophytocola xanthii]